MENVVSYKFRDSDKLVANDVKRLVKSHLLTWQDEEDLGGTPLWNSVAGASSIPVELNAFAQK
jgi:hypothetical protein